MNNYKDGYRQAIHDIQNFITKWSKQNADKTEEFEQKLKAMQIVLVELQEMIKGV